MPRHTSRTPCMGVLPTRGATRARIKDPAVAAGCGKRVRETPERERKAPVGPGTGVPRPREARAPLPEPRHLVRHQTAGPHVEGESVLRVAESDPGARVRARAGLRITAVQAQPHLEERDAPATRCRARPCWGPSAGRPSPPRCRPRPGAGLLGSRDSHVWSGTETCTSTNPPTAPMRRSGSPGLRGRSRACPTGICAPRRRRASRRADGWLSTKRELRRTEPSTPCGGRAVAAHPSGTTPTTPAPLPRRWRVSSSCSAVCSRSAPPPLVAMSAAARAAPVVRNGGRTLMPGHPPATQLVVPALALHVEARAAARDGSTHPGSRLMPRLDVPAT